VTEHPFREYPDPVVAAYLERVRSLPDSQFARLNQLPEKRVVRWNDPLSWLFAPILLLISMRQALLRSAMRRFGMGGCRDPEVLREYKIFWAQLAHRGATGTGETKIALGLLWVRSRDGLPEARENYLKSMDAFVPISSIGWTN